MFEAIVPDWPAPANVRALATTRRGGLGSGVYASFNLATHVGDDAAVVAANRDLLRECVSVPPFWLNQVHGTRCVGVDEAVPGTDADAAWTRGRRFACAVLTADCLPLLLCDETGSVVAAAHAGWRGLLGGVIESTVAAMATPGGRLMAWLGPAIGPAAFEVGGEVRAAFVAHDPAAASAFAARGGDKWLCDLYALARQRLAAQGVERLFGGSFCTVGEPDRFFSYRREGTTGRMASLIWLEA
jgi:YfiH family protein